MAKRQERATAGGRRPATARQARKRRTATSAGTRSRTSTTRTSTSCAGTSPRRARSARGASPARAGATRCRSRSRSSAPARWRCCPTSRERRSRCRSSSQDVDKVGLRGDVVTVARGYARNFLLPRKLAEEATPARVAEMRKRDDAAGAPRGEDRSTQAQRDRGGARRRRSSLRGEGRPDRARCSARSRRPTSPTRSGARRRSASTAARSTSTAIKRIGRYRCRSTSSRTSRVEVKTLVVPEGGELPPEEELEAMEAAETEAAEPEVLHARPELEELIAEEPEPPGRGRGRQSRRSRSRTGAPGRRRGAARARRTTERAPRGALFCPTPFPRPVELREKFPLAPLELSTGAPSDTPATMSDSPANGAKRHVHK